MRMGQVLRDFSRTLAGSLVTIETVDPENVHREVARGSPIRRHFDGSHRLDAMTCSQFVLRKKVNANSKSR